MTARPNVDEIEARAKIQILCDDELEDARADARALCAYVRELEARLPGQCLEALQEAQAELREERGRHQRAAVDRDDARSERDQAIAERDAARELCEKTMDAIHEAAGIRRDGLCAILAWIADAKEACAKLAEVEAQAAAMREALRPVLWDFALRMEAELKRNDHKGGWRRDAPKDLFRRLEEEAFELSQAMVQGTKGNDCVTSEAADVANFAMMLADLSGRLEPVDFGGAGRALLAEVEALREVADATRSPALRDYVDLGRGPLADALAALDAMKGGSR